MVSEISSGVVTCKVTMSKRLKHWLICLAIALASYGAVDLLGRFSNVQQLHLKSLDAHFIFRGTVKPSNIVLLLVDDKSLNTFPELSMFWHPYYAEAIRASAEAGAKALALDIAFAVPVAKWEPEHDSMLAAAVSEASEKMPVVCGYVPGVMTKRPDWSVPINMIASALQLSAYVNLTTDADDFIRRQELIEPALDGAASGDLLPRSLALRLAEEYLGADDRLENAGRMLRARRVPTAR